MHDRLQNTSHMTWEDAYRMCWTWRARDNLKYWIYFNQFNYVYLSSFSESLKHKIVFLYSIFLFDNWLDFSLSVHF
jgi:hypothetical protein